MDKILTNQDARVNQVKKFNKSNCYEKNCDKSTCYGKDLDKSSC